MTLAPWLLVSLLAANPVPAGEVLDFTASWCGPCKQMSPIVDRLKRHGYPIRKVDVDQHPDLMTQYKVSGIPAFVVVVNGQEVDRRVGAISEQQLIALCRMIPAAEPAPSRNAPLVATPQQPRGDTSSRFPLSIFSQRKAPKTNPATADEPSILRGKIDDAPPRQLEVKAPRRLAVTVRIRVKDATGINFGTGTIIDSQPGQTLIITCGHVLRDLASTAVIEVDLFATGKTETRVARMVKHDLTADVGLISLSTDEIYPVAKIAPAGFRLVKGTPVYSVGCGGGDDPTVEEHAVTALDRYRGPATIECSGVPQQGRSGGGLFLENGTLVGICSAADTKESRGLYAGLPAVHDLLTACQLTRLFESQEASASEPQLADKTPRRTPAKQASVPKLVTPANGATAEDLEQSALEAVQAAFAGRGDFEVICVIRPTGRESASRVVVLNRPSRKFLAEIDQEASEQPQNVSMKQPRPQPYRRGE